MKVMTFYRFEYLSAALMNFQVFCMFSLVDCLTVKMKVVSPKRRFMYTIREMIAAVSRLGSGLSTAVFVK